jgi:hypothetical protein
MTNGKRDYKKEEKLYEKKHPNRDGDRVKRNKARKEAGLKVGDPRQAGHKKDLTKGGSNKKSNVEIVSAKANYAKEVKRKRSKPGNN